MSRWFFTAIVLTALIAGSITAIMAMDTRAAREIAPPIEDMTQISAGTSHSCAIADGQAYCWGNGWGGALGNNSTTSSSVPVAVDTTGVLAGKAVAQIDATGNDHTCALADGQAYCWGRGSSGQLGNNSTTNSPVPVAVDTTGVLAGKTVTQMTASGNNTCALADGQAYCWGSSDKGQLGNNSTTNSSVPVAVDTTGVLAGKTVTQVSLGGQHTCALADDQAYCWGSGSSGVLGNNSTTNSSVPVAVDTTGVLAGKTMTEIAAGNGSTCALADGQAYCWGQGSSGQLGNNSTTNSSVPVAVMGVVVWTPEIASLSLESGYINQTGGILSVYGRDFDERAIVTIGGVDAPVTYRHWAGERLDVRIPASSSPGVVDVVVTNGNGRSDTLTGGFTYKEFIPEIEAVIESNVRVNISGLLFIEGAGFDDAATVTIGGVLAPVVDLQDDSIVVTIPVASAPGVVDVVVTNGNGRSATLHNGFTYIESGTVDSVTFEREGDRVLMTVTGENLIDEIDPESGQGLYWYYYNNLYGGYYGTGGTTFVLNGTSLDWCTEGTGLSEADFEGEPLNGSDDPPCYHLGGYRGEVFFVTPTTFKAWLPGSFDTTSTGTVSINGSAVFTFNSPIPGDEGGVQPVATVDKQSLLGTPTIGKRPTFSGTATPGAAITVTVHSDPVTCTTTADEDGKWSCTLGQDLPAGDHTVYIHLVNPDSTIQELGPYAVTVSTGADTPPVITNDTEQAGDATTNDTTAMGVGAPNTGMERLQQIVASPRGAGVMIAALLAAALVLVAGVYVAMRRTRRALRLSRR